MEKLQLEKQLCFSLYAASRQVIKEYKKLLKPLGITYPQYLVLLVLWEKENIPTTQIGQRLFLETNTLTPLLKRMEKLDLAVRKPSKKDERVMLIWLTKKARAMKRQAQNIPENLFCSVVPEKYNLQDMLHAKKILDDMLEYLQK